MPDEKQAPPPKARFRLLQGTHVDDTGFTKHKGDIVESHEDLIAQFNISGQDPRFEMLPDSPAPNPPPQVHAYGVPGGRGGYAPQPGSPAAAQPPGIPAPRPPAHNPTGSGPAGPQNPGPTGPPKSAEEAAGKGGAPGGSVEAPDSKLSDAKNATAERPQASEHVSEPYKPKPSSTRKT